MVVTHRPLADGLVCAEVGECCPQFSKLATAEGEEAYRVFFFALKPADSDMERRLLGLPQVGPAQLLPY